MINRFGVPVEVVTGEGSPFLAVPADVAAATADALRRQGFAVMLSDGPAVLDSLDPYDPGEVHIEVAEDTDLDELQDFVDRLRIIAPGQVAA
jgi:hypothetical protein